MVNEQDPINLVPAVSGCPSTDGFSLLLKAAQLETDKLGSGQFARVFPIGLSPPTSPPPSLLQHAIRSHHENPIPIMGNFLKPVSIGYGPIFNVDLGPAPFVQTPHLLIEWNKSARTFELYICGTATVGVDSSLYKQSDPPAVLRNFSTFQLGSTRFEFYFPGHLPSWSSSAGQALRSLESVFATGCKDSLASNLRWVAAGMSDKVKALRPNVSWANLIIGAFKSSGRKQMLVADLYAEISRTYKYYRDQRGNKWKNAVRHALSVNTCFFRLNENEYKGGYWSYKEKTGPTTARRCSSTQGPNGQKSANRSRFATIEKENVYPKCNNTEWKMDGLSRPKIPVNSLPSPLPSPLASPSAQKATLLLASDLMRTPLCHPCNVMGSPVWGSNQLPTPLSPGFGTKAPSIIDIDMKRRLSG
ncbi:hypothetical protein DFS34DRAFT_596959 [Phlyctochytrium arcticum]|nr:hypothetical protein DFS34DRAFT_596959 [Phlyctochytrium arcticum]